MSFERGAPEERPAQELSAQELSAQELSAQEIERYSRHILIPEVGLEGQLKLKKARVLLVGAGGLGAPAGMYLAAAGVGTLGLVDFDAVEHSNLQRQILFSGADVGSSKTQAARRRLEGINSEIDVIAHEVKLSAENALEVFTGYDVVIDGTDNFPTRYLINDACALLGKPDVYGSIFRFEGQLSVFRARSGPCYRCLHPAPPPPGAVPSCAEGGVMGVLPGVVGSLQAMEALKLILGVGEPMTGRMLLFDALAGRFTQMRLPKDPACALCGENPSITGLVDYEEMCGLKRPREPLPPEWEIGAAEVNEMRRSGRDVALLDVREASERRICRIEGAKWIALAELEARLEELDRAVELIVYCRMGVRSAQAVRTLRAAGFERARNLSGGILAWADEVDSSMPKY